MVSRTIVINGFGRQRVYPPVGRCVYCGATDGDLGDEHIIPQALGGNIILRDSCCDACGDIIGRKLEGSLLHKTTGMFAALRLRMGFKSKRPKERPKSLPFTFIGTNGSQRIVEIPAKKVPKCWTTYVTNDSPGIIEGKSRTAPAPILVQTLFEPEDFKDVALPGESVQLRGSGNARDLARLMAKIAHCAVVAEIGLDAFEPWLQKFILDQDDCSLHYYVGAVPNHTVDPKGDHSLNLGTWGNDGIRIGVRIRLFCKYGTPDYEVAVGKLKQPNPKVFSGEK
jgi:hypothetical protein